MSLFNRNIVAFFAIVGIFSVPTQAGIRDLLTSARDVGRGLVKETPNILPSPKGLFDAGKQLVAGYPFEFVSNAVNKICSTALAADTIQPKIEPDLSKVNFQLRTACTREPYPLQAAEEMWRSPNFNASKKVVLFSTGWTTTVNDTEAIDLFARAYACRGDTNFIALDVGQLIDTLYTWSAFNTERIGELIAVGLEHLVKIVPEKNIHLIGHSLGAHIAGSAGRYFTEKTGKLVARITGLDPAKPCFNEGETLSGLLRGDAAFIDVIHSNPGVLGKREPLGDVDFYPSGLAPLPTGCFGVPCAHERSWRYYGESIFPGNEHNFMAKRCTSITRLREDRCGKDEQPMGYACPSNIKGNYFLEVNGKPPFGKGGDAKRSRELDSCGKCSE